MNRIKAQKTAEVTPPIQEKRFPSDLLHFISERFQQYLQQKYDPFIHGQTQKHQNRDQQQPFVHAVGQFHFHPLLFWLF